MALFFLRGAVTAGCEQAWLFGGSPTNGYLGSLDGALAPVFNSLAGNVMYLSSLPLQTNPLIDSHTIYIILLVGLLSVSKDQKFGLRGVFCM